jgi:cation:H+ antiporter
VIAPGALAVSKEAIMLDLPFMLAVSIACIPIFMAGFDLTRTDGAFFLFYYSSYLTYLVLDTIGSTWVDPIKNAFLFGILPITVAYMVWRLIVHRRRLKEVL